MMERLSSIRVIEMHSSIFVSCIFQRSLRRPPLFRLFSPGHPRRMDGTWITSAVAERQKAARVLFIACLVAGLVQKPLVSFAWDVETLQAELLRVLERIGGLREVARGASLLGGTAILLRQVFAEKGQRAVGAIAETLAVAGQMWDLKAIQRLLDELRRLEGRDHAKRRGRMAQYSGPRWVMGLLDPHNMVRFVKTSSLVGDFLTCAVAEGTAFHDLCSALSDAKTTLHHFAKYSVPHLARACSVARAHIHGGGSEHIAQPDAAAWARYLRCMHSQSTTKIFDLLGVSSFEDAHALKETVLELARRTWSTKVASRYASVSILDLPCQACEFGAVLSAVRNIHGGGDDYSIYWLLAHLPGDLSELKAMGRRLRFLTNTIAGKGDGLDRQAAGVVTRLWLKGGPEEPNVSMANVFTCARWDMFGLPRVLCPGCGRLVGTQPELGRKRVFCTACQRSRMGDKQARLARRPR